MDLLPTALLRLRMIPRSHGSSPFKIVCGRPPPILKQVSTTLPQVRGDEISQQMEQLGQVINQGTKFVEERVPFPLGEQITNLCLGIRYGSRTGNRTPWPQSGRSIYCCLTTPTAVKVEGVTPWIRHMRMKRHTTQTQKTLSGLCRGTALERRRSSLRRRKRRSQTSPFRMKPHNQLLLLGLINVIFNFTSISTQDDVFIPWAHSYMDFHNTSNGWACGAMPLSVMGGLSWRMSLLDQGDFKPLCSFLR